MATRSRDSDKVRFYWKKIATMSEPTLLEQGISKALILLTNLIYESTDLSKQLLIMTRLPWPRWNASRKRYTNVLDITCSSIVHVVYCVQIAESTPLVGEREDLSSLTKEYAEDDEIYQGKIKVS